VTKVLTTIVWVSVGASYRPGGLLVGLVALLVPGAS
jgi:hypothetical protein